VEQGLRQCAVEAAVENRHDIIQGHLRGNEMTGRIGRDNAEGEGLASKPQRHRKVWRGTGLMACVDELLVGVGREA
jgi:hypothetical protein